MLKKLSEMVSNAFVQCGYDASVGTVIVSDRPDLCQFQCNGAFIAAKKAKKAPMSIAVDAADILRQNPAIQSAEAVAPGFINIKVTDAFILELMNQLAGDAFYGIPQRKEAILIDYGGANVAKPLHIGHLRAAIIGESLKRIARAMGCKVIGDVHLGDWGLQIGLVMAELETRFPDWACFKDSFRLSDGFSQTVSIDELCEIYPCASEKSKRDEVFRGRAKDMTADLQSGREGYLALWKEIMRVSIEDLQSNYSKLNVFFDVWYGESDAEQYVPELMRSLSDQGLLRESDGALVVDVGEEGDKAAVPPIIIKKSDHSNMYSTTDLATLIGRQREFDPDAIWYVVDKRQSLHFTQVFRCARKAGLIRAALEHLGFGTMNGSDGKPYKTRDGGVMRLSDFVTAIIDAAGKKIAESGFVTAADQDDTAQKVAVAAIKFGDLNNHRLKDYIFDIDRFLAFEGKTGSYLIYTVTRINSILKRVPEAADRNTPHFSRVYSDIERDIFLHLLLTGQAFQTAFNERAPNFICDHAYRLASLFSTFYHDYHVSGETDMVKRDARIGMCVMVRSLLVKLLDVLGIQTVESM